MAATVNRQWRLNGFTGFDSLVLKENRIPEIGDSDVLVRWKYASLNYRDLVVSKGTYPLGALDGIVVGSDAAGEVVKIGSQVRLFEPGDRVTGIHLQTWQEGTLKAEDIGNATGGKLDGVLQEYGVVPESGLVKIPDTLDLQQGSTLTIAAITAWDSLVGLPSKRLEAGQWVLTQGSGGVSVFAIQFAKAMGAHVIATSSSQAKMDRLMELGADYVINYKEVPEWGAEAKRIANGAGVDHVIEVGGPGTLRQSLNAIKIQGVISLVGFMAVSENSNEPKLLEVLYYGCIARGVLVSSKQEFQKMNAFIDANNIKPVIDEKVFDFADVPAAYQYMWDQKHFGKLTIKIASK
ncbi:uncharacterized protein TrAtP1_002455 [Trichoderma atroviride]|uniref:Enoyl reductase (ER) domain-containing protein n=1 Tax=Hypocrea atroviridis (strain ATCC 20476 / IMI 206040) TaxID=452589 RepID=G9P1H4_HYPAI|nr:Hypothetical protein TRIATDRAFT_34322 [Trichoderma atroviride IMI 206040]EHK42527.1 Hypothetical protein TRIATDRAFT_34322 [Trichoderma atroviride IMI 206040]UKZ61184.1 hypothetical protein TrAtP1_002455 [Trichoderma atroviride]